MASARGPEIVRKSLRECLGSLEGGIDFVAREGERFRVLDAGRRRLNDPCYRHAPRARLRREGGDVPDGLAECRLPIE